MEQEKSEGRVVLTDEHRKAFEGLFEDGTIFVKDWNGKPTIWVETIRTKDQRFFGPVYLDNGFIASDIPGDRVTSEFLAWARGKMGYQPTPPKIKPQK